MSIIKHVTLQKIVAHDFRYDPRIKNSNFHNKTTGTTRQLRCYLFCFLNIREDFGNDDSREKAPYTSNDFREERVGIS